MELLLGLCLEDQLLFITCSKMWPLEHINVQTTAVYAHAHGAEGGRGWMDVVYSKVSLAHQQDESKQVYLVYLRSKAFQRYGCSPEF